MESNISDGGLPLRPLVEAIIFEVHGSIRVGGKSKEELLASLRDANHLVHTFAHTEILNTPDFRTLPLAVDLTLGSVRVGDLQLPGNWSPHMILSRICELGGKPCPDETALHPHLQLALKGEAREGKVWVSRPTFPWFRLERTVRESWIFSGMSFEEDDAILFVFSVL